MRGAVANLLWGLLARFLALRPVTAWLLRRAKRTPYTPITGAGGQDVYMDRWWLFNPYPGSDQASLRKHSWLPLSIRVHHIMRPDQDRHFHDHPWNARTLILAGGYVEARPDALGRTDFTHRRQGQSARIDHGEYHRIVRVDPIVGALTLFVTYRYRGTWGFLVNGKKVPWRQYLGVSA